MPLPKYIPGWIQLRVELAGPSGQYINTFSFTPQVGLTRFDGAGLAALAQDFANATLTNWKNIVTTQMRFVSVTARDLTDAAGAEGVYFYPVNTVGNVAGELLPANVALASTWRTAKVGPAYRGRTFWGGFPEAATNGDQFTTAYTLALANLLNVILAYQGPLLQSVFFVIASRQHTSLERVRGYVLTTIVDSMRRRLTGRGR